jgi:preprotein translocase subunit SecG
MEKKSIVNVPFIAYEKEMSGKNKIIVFMSIIILILIISIVFICCMFMSFINSHDYRNYDQNGNGQNNINEGTQGDVINESTITEND